MIQRITNAVSKLNRYKTLGLVLAGLYLIRISTYVIENGNVDLKYLSRISQNELQNIKPSINNILSFPLYTQVKNFDCVVRTLEGYNVLIKLSIRYRLNPKEIYNMKTKLSGNYFDLMIKPTILSTLTSMAQDFEIRYLHSINFRIEMMRQLNYRATLEILNYGILIEDIKLIDIVSINTDNILDKKEEITKNKSSSTASSSTI